MSASTQDLEAAFGAWMKALNTGDLKSFWDFFDEECDILDEDFPWWMRKEDFIDHLNFHAGGKGLWESFEWKPREVHFRVIGDTGHIRGFATFRGKPRDAADWYFMSVEADTGNNIESRWALRRLKTWAEGARSRIDIRSGSAPPA